MRAKLLAAALSCGRRLVDEHNSHGTKFMVTCHTLLLLLLLLLSFYPMTECPNDRMLQIRIETATIIDCGVSFTPLFSSLWALKTESKVFGSS